MFILSVRPMSLSRTRSPASPAPDRAAGRSRGRSGMSHVRSRGLWDRAPPPPRGRRPAAGHGDRPRPSVGARLGVFSRRPPFFTGFRSGANPVDHEREHGPGLDAVQSRPIEGSTREQAGRRRSGRGGRGMRGLRLGLWLAGVAVFAGASGAGAAPFAYINNEDSNDVSVIDISTNTVAATVPVGAGPVGVAVTPDGTAVYVANNGENTVSVIDTRTNTVTATAQVGMAPVGVVVRPDGARVCVTNSGDNTVSVIYTSDNREWDLTRVGRTPMGAAISPDGSRVYVANNGDGTVTVIDAVSYEVITTVAVGSGPIGVAVTRDGTAVYVVNNGDNTVSVIDPATNTVTAGPFGAGISPAGFGAFTGP